LDYHKNPCAEIFIIVCSSEIYPDWFYHIFLTIQLYGLLNRHVGPL